MLRGIEESIKFKNLVKYVTKWKLDEIYEESKII